MRKNNYVKETVNTMVLARTVMSNTYELCKKRIASVPVELLNIDTNYQREIKATIKKLIADWDILKCDFLLVSYRDGKFYVIDGQHRYEAAKCKGVDELPCIILTGLTEEDEAHIFAQQNKNVAKLSVLDTFKANMCYQDESDNDCLIDMQINEVCNKFNFIISHANRFTKNDKILRSLSQARKIVALHKIECFKWIIETICNTNWNNIPESTNKANLVVLSWIYTENEDCLEVVTEKLIDVMNEVSPRELLARAQIEYSNLGIIPAMKTSLNNLIAEIG